MTLETKIVEMARAARSAAREIARCPVEQKNRVLLAIAAAIENEADTRHSRLAWCYGDLGISLAFLEAGKHLGKDFYSKGLDVALKSCKRRDPGIRQRPAPPGNQ